MFNAFLSCHGENSISIHQHMHFIAKPFTKGTTQQNKRTAYFGSIVCKYSKKFSFTTKTADERLEKEKHSITEQTHHSNSGSTVRDSEVDFDVEVRHQEPQPPEGKTRTTKYLPKRSEFAANSPNFQKKAHGPQQRQVQAKQTGSKLMCNFKRFVDRLKRKNYNCAVS